MTKYDITTEEEIRLAELRNTADPTEAERAEFAYLQAKWTHFCNSMSDNFYFSSGRHELAKDEIDRRHTEWQRLEDA